MTHVPRIIVGITGATGAIFGIRLLEELREVGAETHLVISGWGARTIEHETAFTVEEVRALATVVESPRNQAARISSGSFRTDGMVIAPCSMKTLSAIAHGLAQDLIGRAADVVLKERRRLVLLARELPLNEIHIENMLRVTRAGAVVLPPVPAFYNHPQTIDDIVNHVVGRVLDQFDLESEHLERWTGQLAQRAVNRLGPVGDSHP